MPPHAPNAANHEPRKASNRDELEADGAGVVRYLFPAPLRAVLEELADRRRVLSTVLAVTRDRLVEDAAWRGRLDLAQAEADVLERWRRRRRHHPSACARLGSAKAH